MSTELILLIIAAITSIAACIAAWNSAVSARASNRFVRTQTILDIIKRDGTNEMRKAILNLWAFYNKYSDNMTKEYVKLRESGLSDWNDFDNDRRIVHKFFLHIMQAKLSGLLTDHELMHFITKAQLETIIKIIIPLEKENVGYKFTKKFFDNYQKIYDNYEALYLKYFGSHLPA